jgi:hypothetical protein
MRDFLFTFIVTNRAFRMCQEETRYCVGSDSKGEVPPFWLFCSDPTFHNLGEQEILIWTSGAGESVF